MNWKFTVGLTVLGASSMAQRPQKDKHGNNGSVDCRTYCRGDYDGGKYESCVGAFDTAANMPISCGTTRGLAVQEVTCTCNDEPETIKHNNNGAVSCTEYCRGDWGSRKFSACKSAFDTQSNKEISCGVTRGIAVPEVTCQCVDEPETIKHNNNGAVSCHDYCRGDYGAPKFASCKSAFDTAANTPFPCSVARGVAGPEVTCECSHEPEHVKHNNNGAVSCHDYCRGDWGSRRFSSCSKAIDTAANADMSCYRARGLAAQEVTCHCSDSQPIQSEYEIAALVDPSVTLSDAELNAIFQQTNELFRPMPLNLVFRMQKADLGFVTSEPGVIQLQKWHNENADKLPKHDAVLLITTKMEPGLGGIAFMAGRDAMSIPRADIIAHEIGHLLSMQHTDGEKGSIMAASHGDDMSITPFFAPGSIQVARDFMAKNWKPFES